MEQINNKLMNWASILADNARAQAERAASMPFIYPHIALMPDAHLGKGATVGSVIPTLGAIIPAAVGVDIGCGMIALRTQFSAQDVRARADLATLREAIERAIPLSAGKYNGRIYSDETTARITELEQREGADSAEQIAPNWRFPPCSPRSCHPLLQAGPCRAHPGWAFLRLRGVGLRSQT